MQNWKLFAAGFWGLLALVMALRNLFLDAAVIDRFPIRNWTIATLFSAFLCVWNLARWYQARLRWQERGGRSQPLQRNRTGNTAYEYNPDFDFQKMDREGK